MSRPQDTDTPDPDPGPAGDRSGTRTRGEPLSAEERRRIVDLADQGWARNRIAAETGRSAGTVTSVAHAAGRSFDRAATAAATAARSVDLEARLTETQEVALAAVRRGLARYASVDRTDHRGAADEARGTAALGGFLIRMQERADARAAKRTDHSEVGAWLASLDGGGVIPRDELPVDDDGTVLPQFLHLADDGGLP